MPGRACCHLGSCFLAVWSARRRRSSSGTAATSLAYRAVMLCCVCSLACRAPSRTSSALSSCSKEIGGMLSAQAGGVCTSAAGQHGRACVCPASRPPRPTHLYHKGLGQACRHLQGRLWGGKGWRFLEGGQALQHSDAPLLQRKYQLRLRREAGEIWYLERWAPEECRVGLNCPQPLLVRRGPGQVWRGMWRGQPARWRPARQVSWPAHAANGCSARFCCRQ